MTISGMHSRPSPEQRRQVEDLVRDLPGGPAHVAFDEPWEIRAFALVVAAHTSTQFPWSDFQEALVASISSWEASAADGSKQPWSYYEHWVNAFERVLDSVRAFDAVAVDNKTQEVLKAPPNRNHHEPHYEPVAVDPAIRSRGQGALT